MNIFVHNMLTIKMSFNYYIERKYSNSSVLFCFVFSEIFFFLNILFNFWKAPFHHSNASSIAHFSSCLSTTLFDIYFISLHRRVISMKDATLSKLLTKILQKITAMAVLSIKWSALFAFWSNYPEMITTSSGGFNWDLFICNNCIHHVSNLPKAEMWNKIWIFLWFHQRTFSLNDEISPNIVSQIMVNYTEFETLRAKVFE